MRKKESKREEYLRPDDIFEDVGFRWLVSVAGYRWDDLIVDQDQEQRDNKPTRVLVDQAAVGQGEVIEYTPLALPPDLARRLKVPLFVAFAGTPPTEEGVLRFATDWGFLSRTRIAFGTDPTSGNVRRGWAEPFDTWSTQISRMSEALSLWRVQDSGDRQRLGEWLRWSDRGGRRGRGGWIYKNAEALDPSAVPAAVRDVCAAARLLVQRWVNRELRTRVSPQVLWDLDRQRQSVRILPHDLLGALWLQFARYIVGDVHYRPCKVCGKWLTISTEDHGYYAHREFCSAACRQKDHRNKVKEARRLRVEGKTTKQIAADLGVKINSVKKWVSKNRRG